MSGGGGEGGGIAILLVGWLIKGSKDLGNLSLLYSPGLKAKQTNVPKDYPEKLKFSKVNTGLEPVQSRCVYCRITKQFIFKSFSHTLLPPRTTALRGKESELQIRSMGLCQSQKSLWHEAKQTLQHLEEREISRKPQGTFPRRPQSCWEWKDSVGRYIHEFNFVILKGHCYV